MPIMAGKPKGFGDLLKQQKKSPKSDRSKPQFQIIFPDNDVCIKENLMLYICK